MIQNIGRLNCLLGAVGAVVGGLLGSLAFGWLARQGFYAVALPGALLGLGWGWLAKHRSVTVSALCGLAALAVGVFSEWRYFPFVADPSFAYFLAHVHLLPAIKLLMILLGGVFGFWFSLGRRAEVQSSAP